MKNTGNSFIFTCKYLSYHISKNEITSKSRMKTNSVCILQVLKIHRNICHGKLKFSDFRRLLQYYYIMSDNQQRGSNEEYR
jgi:hypothetical protein